MENKPFFKRCKVWWLGGYYVQVRNSMNNQLEKEPISAEEKEQYEKEIGQKILTDYEFIDWYVKSKRDLTEIEKSKS